MRVRGDQRFERGAAGVLGLRAQVVAAQLQQVVGEQHDGQLGQQFGPKRLAADAALQRGEGLHAAGVDGVGVGGF